jgi:hypothetical protein
MPREKFTPYLDKDPYTILGTVIPLDNKFKVIMQRVQGSTVMQVLADETRKPLAYLTYNGTIMAVGGVTHLTPFLKDKTEYDLNGAETVSEKEGIPIR